MFIIIIVKVVFGVIFGWILIFYDNVIDDDFVVAIVIAVEICTVIRINIIVVDIFILLNDYLLTYILVIFFTSLMFLLFLLLFNCCTCYFNSHHLLHFY